MRHIYAYRVTYLIAAIIVLVAMLFAWLRSQDVPPPRETAVGQAHRAAAVAAAEHPRGPASIGKRVPAHVRDAGHGRTVG